MKGDEGFTLPENTKRSNLIVGISDMVISTDPSTLLTTYSLGSCLGLTVYDPVALIGGMIHCMLPLSSLDPAKAREKPTMFVDVGVPALFAAFFKAGGSRSRMIVKAAGCAQILDPSGHFRIGERNKLVLNKLLTKNNIELTSQSTGGSVSRTMQLEISTGRTTIKSPGIVVEI
ncbi:MAG: chemotaxis protein CheD [Fibrobacter sp.]|jgi:chemotaxis protein CheD|nr:chemotaxis protein CheD [Fibrobacter sp.]